MHADEIHTDAALVRRLIARQFPHWVELPIAPVASAGTDNALYRLGGEFVVRLPRLESAALQVEKEQRWLPRLAPALPLAIPVPAAQGMPTEEFPWAWSVYRWLDGENATIENLADPNQAAVDLARFITALRSIDAKDGPAPGDHNFHRGVALAERDQRTRAAIKSLDGIIDIHAAMAIWEEMLRAPAWLRASVWIHGDLQSGNLLCRDGRLSAVIDFGGLAVGDPACDMMVAWSLLPPAARRVFREKVAVDDATWDRGRGWALSVSAIVIPYYRVSNPVLAGIARVTIAALLTDRDAQV